MEKKVYTRVSPDVVWNAWEKAHAIYGSPNLQEGFKGTTQKNGARFQYLITEVIPGKQFSIVWKTFFVKLHFTHCISPALGGCEISYRVRIKGLFSFFVKWLLKSKIQSNLDFVLKTMIRQLEQETL